MSTYTKTFYKCDRCGQDMNKPVIGVNEKTFGIYLSAYKEFFKGTGVTSIEWNDLCSSCSFNVDALVTKLIAESEELKNNKRTLV